MKWAGPGLLVLLVWIAPAAFAADFEVTLTVHESAGVDRVGEPVSGGVPLPQGLVKDPAELRLIGPDGRDVPAQFSAINRWMHDGSVMWVLVQGVATVSANGETAYRLKPGVGAAPRGLLKVEDGAQDVTVDTGRIKVSISRKKFNLIDTAWVDADGDGTYAAGEQVVDSEARGGSVLTVKSGEVYASGAGAPRDVVVEESGPERAVVTIRGLHTPVGGKGQLPWCYGYLVRIRAYAGQSCLRISYGFTDDAMPAIGSPELKDSAVGIALKLGGAVNAALGGRDKASVSLESGAEVGVLCNGTLTERPRRTAMSEPRWIGLEAEAQPAGDIGWAAAGDSRLGASLSVRYLRENWPSALKVRREADRVWLEFKPWPAEIDAERYLDPCSHKTYEMELAFGPAREIIDKAPERFAKYGDALRFWPAVEWTAASKAWGDFGGLMLPDTDSREEAGKLEAYAFTGWRDFGSIPAMESGSSSAPGGGYEPLACDGAYYLGYMKTGDRRLFDQIERTSWHWRDRRKIHLEADVSKAKWFGNGIYSKYAEGGARVFREAQAPSYEKRYVKGNIWGYGGKWGPMDTQHFSVDEVVNYYYLTGDRQCLGALTKYAEQAAYFVLSTAGDVAEEGASREHGWTSRALVAVYEATGEKRWFEAARTMVLAVCRGQDKTAGTISPIHIPPGAKHQTHTPFMNAVVGMALGRYYRHHPEDEEIRDAILGIADWLSYDVCKEADGFSYHWSENDPGERSTSGNRCMSTMAWAYMGTGQRRYLDAAETHGAIWKPSKWHLSGFGQEYLQIKTGKREDATPPAAVGDLAATALGGGRVELTWTAPGDDGDKGRAAEYQVKHSDRAIKERGNWRAQAMQAVSFWAATNGKGEPKPQAAGARERMVVDGLKPGVHCFALKTYDEQPNQSDLSNVVKVEVK